MKKALIEKKIISLLKKKGPFLKNEKQNLSGYNYIKSGHIDSLNLMKFIFQVEDIFKVKFSYKQISSTKFGVISGLANIIEKKINEKK